MLRYLKSLCVLPMLLVFAACTEKESTEDQSDIHIAFRPYLCRDLITGNAYYQCSVPYYDKNSGWIEAWGCGQKTKENCYASLKDNCKNDINAWYGKCDLDSVVTYIYNPPIAPRNMPVPSGSSGGSGTVSPPTPTRPSPTQNIEATFTGFFRQSGKLEVLKFVRNSPNNISLYSNSVTDRDWHTDTLMSEPFYWPRVKGCKQGIFTGSGLDTIACVYDHGDMNTGIVVFRPQSPGSSSWLVESWWSEKPFNADMIRSIEADDYTRSGATGLKIKYAFPNGSTVDVIFSSDGKKFTKVN